MQNNQIKFANFEKAILERAKAQRDKSLEDYEEKHKSELEKIRSDLTYEFDNYIARQFQQINLKVASDVSKNTAILKQQIFKRREELKKEVFAEVLIKLNNFTNSDEYLSYLLRKLKELTDNVLAKNSIVFSREEDKKYLNNIKATLPLEVEVVFSERVKIGGFIIENLQAGIINDESIDLKLSNANNWFYENSGLSVFNLQ